MILEYANPIVSMSKSDLDKKIADVKRNTAIEIIKELEKFADDKERQKLIGDRSVWVVSSADLTDFIASLWEKHTEAGNDHT